MENPDGQHRTANYTTFRVSDEQSLYVLTVTGYNGDAGRKSNKIIFSRPALLYLITVAITCYTKTTVLRKFYSVKTIIKY